MVNPELKRAAVVHYHLNHPSATFRQVARATGTSNSFVHKWVTRYKKTRSVQNKRRKKHATALQEEVLAELEELAVQQKLDSIPRLAVRFGEQFGVQISPSTLARWMKDDGWQFGTPKQINKLTAVHRARREAFARRMKDETFEGFLFTDSKIFRLFPPKSSRLLAGWYHRSIPGSRRSFTIKRQSQQIHAYARVTAYGITRLIFVSGTTGRVSPYNKPNTSKPYAGVCAQEYQECVVPALVEDAQQIFARTPHANTWVFQQDNARIHTTQGSMECIGEAAPGGLLEDWPACSPDLSWIENIWAWMEHELRRRPQCRNIKELEGALLDIWEDLGKNHKHILTNCVASMPGRMEKVIEAKGAPIGS
jgi:transposase